MRVVSPSPPRLPPGPPPGPMVVGGRGGWVVDGDVVGVEGVRPPPALG